MAPAAKQVPGEGIRFWENPDRTGWLMKQGEDPAPSVCKKELVGRFVRARAPTAEAVPHHWEGARSPCAPSLPELCLPPQKREDTIGAFTNGVSVLV